MITSPLSGRSTSSGSVDKLSVGDTSSFAMLTRLEMHCTDIGPRSLTKDKAKHDDFRCVGPRCQPNVRAGKSGNHGESSRHCTSVHLTWLFGPTECLISGRQVLFVGAAQHSERDLHSIQ